MQIVITLTPNIQPQIFNDLKQATGKEKTTLQTDGPGKGKAKGKGQSIACIATQMNNGHGKEKKNQTSNREILFAYDEHRLLGEYDTQGKAIQETVWLGNLPVATLRSDTAYFIHTDHLGTPRVITDNSNTEVWRWDSDPFGMAAANEDPDGGGVKLIDNLRFPGQYYDEETGKHYNYFRDYDPSTGKYIESDPIGLKGGTNTYRYTADNPVTNFDSNGLIHCNCLATGPGQDRTISGTVYKQCWYSCSCDCDGKKLDEWQSFYINHAEGMTCIGQQGYYQMAPFEVNSSKTSPHYWFNLRVPDDVLNKLDELCTGCDK